jgi:hypothetical protein
LTVSGIRRRFYRKSVDRPAIGRAEHFRHHAVDRVVGGVRRRLAALEISGAAIRRRGGIGVGEFIGNKLFGVSNEIANTSALIANTAALSANTVALGGSAAVGAAGGAATVTSGAGGIFSFLSGAAGLLGFARGGIVPSAAGGWARPSFAGATPAMLHSREMVLPSHIAGWIEQASSRGAGGA